MSKPSKNLAVLGGGNTGFALAANLTLRGYEVTLWEAPSHAATLAPLADAAGIHLTGTAEQGMARLHRVTTDIREALEPDVLLVPVPSYAHEPFARQMTPHLRPGHIVTLMPGNLGSLALARWAQEAGRADGVVFAEVDTAPYVCRKLDPTHVHIYGVVTGLGLGAFPARETERAEAMLSEAFSGLWTYPNVLACGLSATNPVAHPAGVIMNAGRIEYSRGDFYFYEEGVTPGVVLGIKAVDAERMAVGAALGLSLDPVEEGYWKAGFGPRGDLWATINGSRMLTQLRAPGSLETRWLSEDIPFGIACWALIGAEHGIPTPLMRAFTDIGSAVTGVDCWKQARTPADLGIAGRSPSEIAEYLERGRLT